MAFKDLNNEELAEVAKFFAVEVVATNPDKPTKKELVAALAAGDQPVTWEDYTDTYLVAKANGKDKNKEVLAMEKAAEAVRLAEEQRLADIAALEAEEDEKGTEEQTTVVLERDTSNDIVVKCERKNPRFEIAGLAFTTDHPYALVDPETAQFLINNVGGFRPALPQEVADYYGVAR